jgi:hypothetical protein
MNCICLLIFFQFRLCRFTRVLQFVNFNYRPVLDVNDHYLFPNVKVNCCIHNCLGNLDIREAGRIIDSLQGSRPMVIIISHCKNIVGNPFIMLRRYGFSGFATLKHFVGNYETHIIWRQDLVDYQCDFEKPTFNLFFKAKGEEAWQQNCIRNLSPVHTEVNLWRKLERYARANGKPWSYLHDMERA